MNVNVPAAYRGERTSFDFTELSASYRYKLMIGTIIPRPIGDDCR